MEDLGWVKLPTIEWLKGSDGGVWSEMTYKRLRCSDIKMWEAYTIEPYQQRVTQFPVTKVVVDRPMIHTHNKRGEPFGHQMLIYVPLTPEQIDKLLPTIEL